MNPNSNSFAERESRGSGGLWLTFAAAAGLAATAVILVRRLRRDDIASGVEDLIKMCDAAARKLEDRVSVPSDALLQAS